MGNEVEAAVREIESSIKAVERNEILDEEANFFDRVQAIDFIEFHIIDRIAYVLADGGRTNALTGLKQRAESSRNRLEQTNEKLFQRLRANIRLGNYTGEQLRRQLGATAERASQDDQNGVGYDVLNVFVSGLLQVSAAPEPTQSLEPEMVPYQPTPVRAVLELVERANLTGRDVFYDIGSGLGQVPILIRLLSDARTKGIELEPAYCHYARACAKRLNLSQVEFHNVDAREADYSDGTIFFLYTPFRGRLLQEVLDKLERESRQRPIKIYAYGPCIPQVSSQSWLKWVGQNAGHEYELAVFESVH